MDMDVPFNDFPSNRHFRRTQLGLRFLAHGARAQTTSQWTGLTPDQIVTLRRRWIVQRDHGLRGPSPSSFQHFFRSRKAREQASLFVCICQIAGAMPLSVGMHVVKRPPSLEDGERLCDAYEIYREWEGDAEIEFEQAVLLVRGAVEAEKIELTHCLHCSSALLIDKLGSDNAKCSRCRRGTSNPASQNATLPFD